MLRQCHWSLMESRASFLHLPLPESQKGACELAERSEENRERAHGGFFEGRRRVRVREAFWPPVNGVLTVARRVSKRPNH